MIQNLVKFVSKLLGFQSEEYLRRQQAYKDAKKYEDSFSIVDYITPFSFVLVTINTIVVILALSESYNFSNTNSPIFAPVAHLMYILILSGFCATCYVVLNDSLFQRIKKLKSHPDIKDGFLKMIVKIAISCTVTHAIFFLLALI